MNTFLNVQILIHALEDSDGCYFSGRALNVCLLPVTIATPAAA